MRKLSSNISQFFSYGRIKTACLFVLLSTACMGFGQNSAHDVVHISPLTAQGAALDSGWKFRPGDDPAWTKAEWNDADWASVKLNQPASRWPKAALQGINSYRLHFQIDPAVTDTLLALSVEQFGASEIYLDGKPLKQWGKFAPAKEFTSFNPHNQPLPLLLTKGTAHVLVVQFMADLPSSDWELQRSKVAPLSIRLLSLTDALSTRQESLKGSRSDFGFAYVNLVFGLLFLLLYGFYPRHQLNLFFGLYSILLAANIFNVYFLAEGQYSMAVRVQLTLVKSLFDRLIGISMLLFMLSALFHRISPFFRWFAIAMLADFLIGLFLPVSYQVVSNVLRSAFTLVFVWTTIKAFRTGSKEEWLLGLVSVAVLFINASFVVLSITGMNITSYAASIVPVMITVAMVSYLALRYARANRSLEKQLAEVSKLSKENLRQEQEKQQILSAQKETLEQQVTERTAQLKQSLEELKAAQAQLIQSEKMASLGELTAGIAHEIQNPLNFVNNFSEVSMELMDDLKKEATEGNTTEVVILANEISDNLQKVVSHGRRADGIVKGMLQHSRASTGEKQPTDINALADEYLRLSYQAIRSKNKSFQATVETHFDNTLGKINAVPQDIGRVLLNLFQNAFYAVNKKKEQLNGTFEPIVFVSTKQQDDKVEIIVKDNGTGMSPKVANKVFQPFFTTKPTGEGTGLGLSLSYDIITKGHGGELKVESKEGEYTEFIIQLPL